MNDAAHAAAELLIARGQLLHVVRDWCNERGLRIDYVAADRLVRVHTAEAYVQVFDRFVGSGSHDLADLGHGLRLACFEPYGLARLREDLHSHARVYGRTPDEVWLSPHEVAEIRRSLAEIDRWPFARNDRPLTVWGVLIVADEQRPPGDPRIVYDDTRT